MASPSFRSDGQVPYEFWSLSRFVNKPTVREARHVSFVSIVLTILTCIIGLVAAIVGASAATLGYSLVRVTMFRCCGRRLRHRRCSSCVQLYCSCCWLCWYPIDCGQQSGHA